MRAIIVQDLGFGDFGKGATVDYLANKLNYPLVIRHSGGGQCGHNVHANGLHHCFSQFGSHSFGGGNTILLSNVIVNPWSMEVERKLLLEKTKIDFQLKQSIHEDCLITTPYHIAWNRITERRNNHGSCGAGCWATIEYAEKYTGITYENLWDAAHLNNKRKHLLTLLEETRQNISNEVGEFEDFDDYTGWLKVGGIENLADSYIEFARNYAATYDSAIAKEIWRSQNVIFEGNQGTLLDPDFGFHPNVTANSSTTKHAKEFLKQINYQGEIYTLGVVRPYMTRHGAGPLNCEKEVTLEGENNATNEWQKNFRVGPLDLTLLSYSLNVCPVDGLVVNCLDNDPFDIYLENWPQYYQPQWPHTIEGQVANTAMFKRISELPAEKWKSWTTGFKSSRNTINKAAEIADLLDLELKGVSFSPQRKDRWINL